jgi:hypothetical protein
MGFVLLCDVADRALCFVYVNYDDIVCCAYCKIVSTCNRVCVALRWDGDLASHERCRALLACTRLHP